MAFSFAAAKILAGILAAASAASLASCSSDGSGGTENITTTAKTEWTGDNVEVTAAEDVIDEELDINGKSLKWMGFYDLNPTNDNPERETQVALFEDVYGAKLEYIPTTYSTQFDDPAISIIIHSHLCLPDGRTKISAQNPYKKAKAFQDFA